jgi:ribonuclease D
MTPQQAYMHTVVAKGAHLTIHLYQKDLPDGLDLGACVAVDTETMGLDPRRDRLCLVQLSAGDGDAHLVQIAKGQTSAPNLAALMSNPDVIKLFHFARFDIASIFNGLGVVAQPVFCTKIASKMVRSYTDRHGLRNLVQECAGTDISKQQQSSDWGAPDLTKAQLDYAASDVLHLHAIKADLERRLAREGRAELAKACFDFLPTRAQLDLLGWGDPNDIFQH